MDIACFSISSNDQLDKVYILLNSLKNTKQKDTNIKYYLLLELDQQKDMQYCINYFQPLSSTDYNIIILGINQLLKTVDKKLAPPYTNIKNFAPAIFKEDKILGLDTDMVFIQGGIQELWSTDITDYYIAAVEEPIVTYFMKQELENTQTTRYFNTGTILLNLKKIREDKLDDELIKMTLNWDISKLQPIVRQQTLMNYLLKDKVKFIDFKFNNTILILTHVVLKDIQKFLKEQYNTDFIQSMTNAVIYHFLGQNKPWKKEVREKYSAQNDFPFKEKCIQIWDFLEKVYKRPK